jgi:hypothetical protein
VLEGISTAACPANMVKDFVGGFLQEGNLVFHEIVFNINTEDDGEQHEDNMERLAQRLSRYVLLSAKLVKS